MNLLRLLVLFSVCSVCSVGNLRAAERRTDLTLLGLLNNVPVGATLTIYGTLVIDAGATFSVPSSSLSNAAADGTTKGVATFAAADFNAASGVISIDYTNGQAASGSVKGFLNAADWTTFNTKAPIDSPTFTTQITAPKVIFTGSVQDLTGTGSPEGVITAAVGSTFRRTDGGTSTTLYVKEAGAGNTGWAAAGAGGGGSGTVTNTGGNLTANAVVLGAGTVDAKVVAGITTDGTSALNLGVAGSSVGKLVLANATSGTITLQPVTGALGTVTLSVPAATATLFASSTLSDVLQAATFAADAGANDTYAATLSPAITSYVTGAHYRFKANTANTGAASINLNALGAKTIVKITGGITTALADNDIRAGQWVSLVYDGTNMQMHSPAANGGTGDVSGPASSTDFAIAMFSGTGGKTLKQATTANFALFGDASGNIFLQGPAATNSPAIHLLVGGFSKYTQTYYEQTANTLWTQIVGDSASAVSLRNFTGNKFLTLKGTTGLLQANAYGVGIIQSDASGNFSSSQAITPSTVVATGNMSASQVWSSSANAVVGMNMYYSSALGYWTTGVTGWGSIWRDGNDGSLALWISSASTAPGSNANPAVRLVVTNTGLAVTGAISATDNISTTVIGKTLLVKSGANSKAGTFTLAAGTVTVSNSSVTANSVIVCTLKTVGGTRAGNPDIVPTASTGFVATGGGSDTSTYNYVILEVN